MIEDNSIQKDLVKAELRARELGFEDAEAFLRYLISANASLESHGEQGSDGVREYYRSKSGIMYWGDSRAYMASKMKDESVDLVMTSPPFGLVRKKKYGNEEADRYLHWFRGFASQFHRILKPTGSLVIDIGGAWNPGVPTRSLYHFELLSMMCREYGFHLCQEFYWWNPSKLPSPVEWVNKRRIRVKDAVNSVYWLAKTPWPKANNRRVLAPYSGAQQKLMKNGYEAKLRPSGHDISDQFSKDNKGAIAPNLLAIDCPEEAPNLLAIPNTESSGHYQDYCRKNDLPIHPARFPDLLPEFFVRFLTDPGDVVFDPFAGSCVTGEVAGRLGRKWICCELDESYLKGAIGRFTKRGPKQRRKPTSYSIAPPCSVEGFDDAPLATGEKAVSRKTKK